MNIVSLGAFENLEWLLMTPAVIYNNCNFTKQYWSNHIKQLTFVLGGQYLDAPGDIKLY